MQVGGWLLLGLVALAGSTTRAQLQGAGRQGRSAIPDFVIHFPPGDWEATRNPALAHMALIERRPEAPARATRIDVRIARSDPGRRMPAATVANEIVAREVEAMKARVPSGLTFQVAPFDTIVGCRPVRGTRYALSRRGGVGTTPSEAGVVVAWVSPNYREDGRVVVFRHAGAGRTLREMAREAGPLYHVIDRMELGGVASRGC